MLWIIGLIRYNGIILNDLGNLIVLWYKNVLLVVYYSDKFSLSK